MTNPTPGRHAAAAKTRADDARTRAAKDIAAAENCDRAEAALPPGLPTPDSVSQHAAYATVSIDLTAHDRAEALDFFEVFGASVLPLARVKDGCLSFRPSDRIKERERERADILEGDDLWPLVWRYDPSGYKGGASLEWYATLAEGLTAHVRCRIANDPARNTSHHQHAGKTTRSQVVRYQWRLNDAPNGERDRFSSGSHDRCGEYVFYFHVEPNNGPTPQEYLRTTDADCECSTDWHERRPTCGRCVALKAERAAARVERAEAAAKVCGARYCDRPKPCDYHPENGQ